MHCEGGKKNSSSTMQKVVHTIGSYIPNSIDLILPGNNEFISCWPLVTIITMIVLQKYI